MGTLDRYQKKGGFYQIVSLIESSEPEKAKKFLTIIANESSIWEQAIRDKSLSITKIAELGERPLTEGLATMPANIIAVALSKESPEIRTKFFLALGGNLQKKIENAERDNPEPKAGEILACQIKIITAIRSAIVDGRIKQNQLPTNLQIPDNFETQLAIDYSVSSDHHQSSSMDYLPNSNLASASNNEEILSLKRKVHQLLEENLSLRNQLLEANNKIQQIKKWVA